MPTCPKCLEQKPFRSFEKGPELFSTCYECRRREADALRKRRAKQYAAALAKAVMNTSMREAARVKEENARLRSRFLRLTSTTRARIAAMERRVAPTQKTLKALEARRAILRRFEYALAQQLDMVRLGLPPGDIMDMV